MFSAAQNEMSRFKLDVRGNMARYVLSLTQNLSGYSRKPCRIPQTYPSEVGRIMKKIQPKCKKLYYNNLNTDYFDYICQIMTNHIVMMFAQRIKTAREEKGLLQKELAMALNIDVPMYSRIERGDRNAKREQVLLISHLLCIEREELLSLWIADKVNAIINNENEVADKALKLITKSRYGNKY